MRSAGRGEVDDAKVLLYHIRIADDLRVCVHGCECSMMTAFYCIGAVGLLFLLGCVVMLVGLMSAEEG